MKHPLLMIFLLLPILALAAPKVYKWVDQDGNVHYTDQPPPEEQAAQEIDTSASERSESQRQDAVRLEQSRTSSNETRDRKAMDADAERQAAAQAEQDRLYEEQRVKACHSAKTNLQIMQSGGRVFELDENGERVYLNDSERQQRLQHYQQKVAEYCG